jgi:hypothetical protein
MAPTWTEWLQERSRALPYEVNRPTQTLWSIRLPAADAVSLRVDERTHPHFSADARKYGHWGVRQRFVIGGLECDCAMFLIITLIPTFLLVLTCVAGKGDMLDIEEELRRIRSASGRRPRSGSGGGLAVHDLTSRASLRQRPKTGMRS